MTSTRILLITFALLIAGTVAAFAAVPQTINYQGYIKDTASGVPVTGSVPITFSLYSSNPTRSNPVWSEPAKPVTVANGIYSTSIGSTANPITASFDVPYYLGINVNGTELPAQPLSSVPYAQRAAVADAVNGTATLSGNTLAQLDTRYIDPTRPQPTSQQIATLRWDQAGGENGTYPVGSFPRALVYDGTSIWVADSGSGVKKINPATGAAGTPIAVGRDPRALAFDGTSIWVANALSNSVMKIDPATGTAGAPIAVGHDPRALAFDGTNIWVANYGSDNVMKINPTTGDVGAPITVGTTPYALAYDGTSIWVANAGSDNVMKINPANGTAGKPINVGSSPYALAYDGTSIWVANAGSNSVIKVNPSGALGAPITVGTTPYALVYDGTSIWVANAGSNSVMKINPVTGSAGAPITVGANPMALAFDGTSIWVANYADGNVSKLTSAGLPVGVQQLADNAVTTTAIAIGAVTSAKISLPLLLSGSDASGPLFSATNVNHVGVEGGSTTSVGVYGHSTFNYGVYGTVDDIAGAGTYGLNSVSGAYGYLGGYHGVLGFNATESQAGVFGQSTNSLGYGVQGYNSTTAAAGYLAAGTTGVVGTAGSAPGSWAGYFTGNVNITGTLTASGSTFPSDLRLKTDVQPLENTLAKVLNLRGVRYVMKADEAKERKIGVIAQELEQEYPELVATDDKGMKSVAYANLTAVLIEAVKGLKAENESLKTRLERLEKNLSGN